MKLGNVSRSSLDADRFELDDISPHPRHRALQRSGWVAGVVSTGPHDRSGVLRIWAAFSESRQTESTRYVPVSDASVTPNSVCTQVPSRCSNRTARNQLVRDMQAFAWSQGATYCRIPGSGLPSTFRAGFHEKDTWGRRKITMDAFPHHYVVRGSGQIDGDVELTGEQLPRLRSASPAQFDGPGDRWSPETLLVGAVADCFILTFSAVARASKVSWTSLDCEVTGTLDRIERVLQFTHFDLRARLTVPDGQDAGRAQQALEKAERACLISSSLKGSIRLESRVETTEPVKVPAMAQV
jgi:organic hydroperoxide reductase OsmC/OhrA